MPIPIEKIQAVEDEIEREYEAKAKIDTDDDDDDHHHHEIRHTTEMTPPDQDFSYLKNHPLSKRSVHYGIEQLDDHENHPLRTTLENDQPLDNGLRRRYIAHWGLPG
jgi:hypothetical protein